MTINRISAALFMAAGLWAGAAQAQNSAQLYEQALRKERTDGDLPAAIALYQQVAAGKDRELAARALMRVGELYERTAREEALKAYRRVVNEFADQKEPARLAKARLAALEIKAVNVKSSANLAMQLVLGNNFDPSGMPTADGRYLTTVDWQNGGDVALYDLGTGSSRLVTESGDIMKGGGYALASSVSRDGKRVAYFWVPTPGNVWRPQVRVINSDGTGERVLFANEDRSVNYVQVHDFTPDGAFVSVVLAGGPQGLVRVGLLSTSDGQFQQLKQYHNAGGPGRVAVSPDGKWIAYDEIADTVTEVRAIVLVARDGSPRSRIAHAAGNQNPIWTPDGKYLLFSSARSGVADLWAVRVVDGMTQGSAVQVKSNLPWGFTVMGFAGDKLLYCQDTGGGDVFAADFDQQAGRVTGTPVNLLPLNQGMNMKGVFTRDGKKLLYASRRGDVTAPTLRLVVRDVATGEEKEIPRAHLDRLVSRVVPSPDGRYVLSKVQGLGPEQILRLIDTHTGEVRTLANAPSNGIWSHDGKAVYYNKSVRGQSVLVRQDIASGDTSSIATPGGYGIALSPAGDSVLQAVRKGNNIDLYIGPIAGGEFRHIAQLSNFGDEMGRLNFAGLAFTPDGKRIVFGRAERDAAKQKTTGNTEVLTVPLSGGEPQSAGLALPDLRGLSFAPDGRLVFTAERMFKLEIWSIENIASRLPN